MKLFVRMFLSFMICLWSHIYTYRLSQWLKNTCDLLYTLWIRNFLGEVGENSSFHYPLRLQGGGSRRIRIGKRTSIQAYSILGAWERYGQDEHYEPEIIIGGNCSIGEFCHITAINRITIGDGLLTGRFVYIGDNSHGGLSKMESKVPPIDRKLQSKGEIIIGNNVWIGDKATILGGVSIGDNVIVGANSVVTKNVLSNTIVAGVPAKVVKSINVCQSQDL